MTQGATMELEQKKTILNRWHRDHGAKMVGFGGWDMPVQYGGIIEEHLATRKHAGLFDVSHMGRFLIRGRERMKFLQHFLTNNAANLAVGTAQYTLLSNENGGAVDDAYLYRISEEEYLLVVNASNAEKDFQWLTQKEPFNVEIENRSEELAMIALQGPNSEKVLQALGLGPLPAPGRNQVCSLQLMSARSIIARTGYTGEPVCFELFVPSVKAVAVWDAILEAGRPLGVVPAGLGARDTLRLEASLPLYGHEYGIDKEGAEIPIFASPLARFGVSFAPEKGAFIGRSALEDQAREARALSKHTGAKAASRLRKRFVPIEVIERGVVREGYDILLRDKPVGWLTSGTMVPYWKFDANGPTSEKGMRSIGLAYVDWPVSTGSEITVICRGKPIKAATVQRNLDTQAPPFARPVLRGVR